MAYSGLACFMFPDTFVENNRRDRIATGAHSKETRQPYEFPARHSGLWPFLGTQSDGRRATSVESLLLSFFALLQVHSEFAARELTESCLLAAGQEKGQRSRLHRLQPVMALRELSQEKHRTSEPSA